MIYKEVGKKKCRRKWEKINREHGKRLWMQMDRIKLSHERPQLDLVLWLDSNIRYRPNPVEHQVGLDRA